jgi:ribonucleoside-diphosphate reductase alpha chain
MEKTIYTYEEALEASKQYFNGDELAADVFVSKYALKNNNGELVEKTPADMHRRLSKEFARIESKYPNPLSEEQIFKLLDGFKYVVPQGSPMSAIGNEYQIQSASNCFVLDSPFDSYAGILHTDQQQAQIMKRRGGVGFDISNIRPKGMTTQNAARTTDGIGVFMERFSNTCREVAQNGRRGALLLSISVHHPEIKTFINIKRDKKKVTGANISIRVTDEFMQAVKNNKDVQLRWPVDAEKPIISKYVSAKDIWQEMMEAAWNSAEPGVLNWDTATRMTPADIYKDDGFASISTNPCGEIVLSKWDSCRLMAINLSSFVEHPFTQNATFNFSLMNDVVEKAQRLMDDVVDIEIELIDKILNKIEADPEPQDIKQIERELWQSIRKACVNGRRTGLGITALGDTLAMLGERYGSEQSIKTTDDIFKTLAIASYRSSCVMAGERGAFPVFDAKKEHNHPFLERIWEAAPDVKKLYKKHGRRNIANTTTAPTGSVSIMTQTTSGIEPAYLLSYSRKKKIIGGDENTRVDFVDLMGDKWQTFDVYHHNFKQWMEIAGKTPEEHHLSPYFGATSNDVDWKASVQLQATAQKWICHAISKTCNLPNSATVSLVSDVYMAAWEQGCKGFTIYRDGCRDGVLTAKTDEKHLLVKTEAPKRPSELRCDVHHVKVKGQEYFVLVGLLNGVEPYEIFAGKNGMIGKDVSTGTLTKKARGKYDAVFDNGTELKDVADHISDEEEAVTRMMSMALRHGAGIEYAVHQLEKVRGHLLGFSKAMSRALKKYIKDGSLVKGEECAECGAVLVRESGCVICKSCGWNKCT